MNVPWVRILAVGVPVLVFGAIVLGASSSAQAMPTRDGSSSGGGGSTPGPGGLTLIDRSDRPWPLPESFKGKTSPRDVSKVDTIVVHQTAVKGGFGLTAGQLKAAGNDPVIALLSRYESTPYHAIASAREGRRFSVFQWPARAYSYHGHSSNSRSIGWAYDGALPGDVLDIDLARQSFAHAVQTARAQGAPIKYVEAHRQHSADRGADPGAEIWRGVVLPMLEPLGLELSSRITGDGQPIPSSWS